MQGGMRAWDGIVAKGFPEKAVGFFASAGSPEEFVALAWLLEEGTRKFYQDMIETSAHAEAVELFKALAAAEDHHQASLSRLYETDLLGRRTDRSLQEVVAAERPEEDFMEGGVPLVEVLAWSRGKPMRDILEHCIGIEADAYDRYLVMKDRVSEKQAQKVFQVLSEEERRHLAKLTDLFEQMA